MSDSTRQESSPRIFFDEPVELIVLDSSPSLGSTGEGANTSLNGRALNLSMGGVYVRTDCHLPEGCRVEARFRLPDDPQLVAVRAHVLRLISPRDAREPAGVALGFECLAADVADQLDRFIAGRLEPMIGPAVRLRLGELSFSIVAQAQAAFGNILAVDAELPFLRLGSPVGLDLQREVGGTQSSQGAIRWVSVHVPPRTGVPRLSIGVELDGPEHTDREVQPSPASASAFDEEADPVCTLEFCQQSELTDQEVRAARRAVAPSA